MFDAVRNNRMITQAILGLIAITFAFFGLESYVRNSGSADYVARIGDVKIDQQQFQQALREQQERLRTQLGGQFDAKLFDTPEARKAILDDLINQRLLMLEANKRRLFVNDDAIRHTILGIEAFQVDGQFSKERYEAALRGQGMTPAGFEAQLRQDLMLQQLVGAVARSSITANTVLDRVLALQTEKRDVSEVRLALEDYLGKVKLADGAAKKYYEENGEQFRLPEQAMAEYVVLSVQPEERRASHILIASEKLGIDKARTKAEEVLAEVRKNPGSFAELARKYSDDPGSAGKGGDLGFFGRGMMVKPFEDATFSLGEGEISGVVQSDFGFHIIKLTGIHAGRNFAEAAETFSNTVYEQADSLAPVAEMFNLKVARSGWLGRQADPASGPLGNEKLLAALFSEDSIKNRRNTEAVEIAPNTLVAARLVDYKPATLQPFEGLQASIETLLRRQEAQALAVKDGEARLEALQKGEDTLSWSASKVVSRMDTRQIPPVAVPVIFRMNAEKLPAYAGVELPGAGYALYRLNRVEAGATVDADSRKAAQGQLANLAAQEEIRLYLAALRERYKVQVNLGALESK
ncbi:SurA N-terminal domain-containing protein [Azonexus sp.]|jgi:peptidyl-prolyl cis-trans isomerase D|uniref:SurA N-terminal domain-containing protein n=1 Tax=Azonexus sp. TaxID=1872668 RepID=UPI00283664F4|nr:SurA N-terminal domain-containing protein [Azonexus sp.]MDR1994049.1 SurA N-terminal domain-containing protein [Azonexus sp.]